jgi:hypothetical protein
MTDGICAGRFLDQVEHEPQVCGVGNELRGEIHAAQQVFESWVTAQVIESSIGLQEYHPRVALPVDHPGEFRLAAWFGLK